MNPAQEWRRVKASLTRAERSGDPARMLQAVASARETFDRIGWPDWWSRIERIERDALTLRTEGLFPEVFGDRS